MDDEADWIRRARAGDREAFSLLVEAHREVAYRTAYWILRDADDAMDVTQEAFLRAYRSLNRFAERSSFRTWLRRIATNAALDRRQRRLREPELPEQLQAVDPTPGAAERLAREETRALVREAIDGLPPASRAAVVLRDVHGLSYAEISETLRIPKGTVMSRIHKGRQLLRRRLADVLGPRAETLQRARQEEGALVSDAELSGYLDGELTPEEEERVLARLTLDAGAPRALAEFEALQELVRDVVPLPDAAGWSAFDAELVRQLDTTGQPYASRSVPVWGRVLLAASVLFCALGLARWLGGEPRTVLAGQRLPDVPRTYSSPNWTSSDPRPLPPLAGILEGPLDLTPAQIAALSSHGLVQVPYAGTSVRELYTLPADGDENKGLPPLASADTSLLLYGAVSSRLALELEEQIVQPEVRRLVDLLNRELAQLAREARGQATRRAARSAQEYVGVLAALEGLPSRLSRSANARVLAEVAHIRTAVGAARSPVLSALSRREVVIDYAALRDRGLFSHEPELEGHGHAMRWLSSAGLPLDPDDPAASRVSCMLVLALSRGQLADGRYGFSALARLEAALEVLYGQPDAVTPFEVLEAMRRVLSQQSLAPSALSDAVVTRIATLAMELTPRPTLGPAGPGELAGVHLLGRLRSLEGQALARLSPARLPSRERSSALDVLAVLADPVAGRRLRSVVSAQGSDGEDPEAYDAAVAGLREEARPWWDPSRPVATRACLEQGRLWTAAALLRRRGLAPAAALNDAWYRDRLLLAAFAACNAPPPSPVDLPPIDGVGPIPVLEPLPELHARLAFSAARLRDVGEQLLGWGSTSVAALDQLARLEAALSSASQDVLADRPVPTSTQAALAKYVPTVQALAPLDVRTVEDLGSGSGGVLHRGVIDLERLIVIGVDPATRRLRVAAGAALVASEWWAPTAQTTADADVAEPSWTTHRIPGRKQ